MHHWGALLFSVIFAALFGQAVLFKLYRAYPVSVVVPWALLIPVFAAISSVIFYSESISLSLVTGGSVILVGVWVQQIGIGRARRGTPLP